MVNQACVITAQLFLKVHDGILVFVPETWTVTYPCQWFIMQRGADSELYSWGLWSAADRL